MDQQRSCSAEMRRRCRLTMDSMEIAHRRGMGRVELLSVTGADDRFLRPTITDHARHNRESFPERSQRLVAAKGCAMM
jgi:hypothetical protein